MKLYLSSHNLTKREKEKKKTKMSEDVTYINDTYKC